MTLLAEPPTVVRCRYPGCNRPLSNDTSREHGYGRDHDPNDRRKLRRARARAQQGPDLLDLIPKETEVPDPAETLAQRLIEGPLADVIAEAGADTGGTVPDIKRRLVADLRATLPEPVGYVAFHDEGERPVWVHLLVLDSPEAVQLDLDTFADSDPGPGLDYSVCALVPINPITEGEN